MQPIEEVTFKLIQKYNESAAKNFEFRKGGGRFFISIHCFAALTKKGPIFLL